jgi:hypothetical protein
MSRWTGDDIEHIGSLLLDHRDGIRVRLWDIESFSRLTRFRVIEVTYRDAVDVRKLLPGRNLEAGPKTTANYGDPCLPCETVHLSIVLRRFGERFPAGPEW